MPGDRCVASAICLEENLSPFRPAISTMTAVMWLFPKISRDSSVALGSTIVMFLSVTHPDRQGAVFLYVSPVSNPIFVRLRCTLLCISHTLQMTVTIIT